MREHDEASRDLSRFLDLATQGLSASSDGDEQAAYLLADAAIEHSPRLPIEAVRGYAVFLALAHHQPGKCRDMIQPDESDS